MVPDLIVIGVAVSLDPMPLGAFVVVLMSKRGVRKAAAFLFGWLASLAVVMAVTVAATGGKPPRSGTSPSTAALAAKIAIGVVLVAFGVRQQRAMARSARPRSTPRWEASVDDMSPWYAMGLALLVQPWALVAGAAATVVQAKVSSVEEALALLGFCALASASYVSMELLTVFGPDRSEDLLGRIRAWMTANTDRIIVVGCLVVGFWLIGHSIYLIVT